MTDNTPTAARNTKSVRHFVNNRMVNMVNTVTMYAKT